jgi:uncharacterized protein involved in response to NO
MNAVFSLPLYAVFSARSQQQTGMAMAIPRYKAHAGPELFSAGFRPFFLAASLWAAAAVPAWLHLYAGGAVPPSVMPAVIWHPHELVYGYAAAVVAGFLLTAIPNWTGRLPLQGWPLAVLVTLWTLGRLAVLLSSLIGAPVAALVDLSFPLAFLAVVAREIIAGKNWRNLPMLAALSLLLLGNLLVHLEMLGFSETAQFGNRIGIAALLAMIALVGGRIVPSFTRNWLVKNRPAAGVPAPADRTDTIALVLTVLGVALWMLAPDEPVTGYALIVGGAAAAWRLSRWRTFHTTSEVLLLALHVGYAWLAAGLLLLGFDILFDFMLRTAALHALTVGAIGTMTLAVMTRSSLGHTGRPLSAGRVTIVIYGLISLAAFLRLIAPFAVSQTMLVLSLAGAAWSAAFLLFAVFYGRALSRPRVSGEGAKSI